MNKLIADILKSSQEQPPPPPPPSPLSMGGVDPRYEALVSKIISLDPAKGTAPLTSVEKGVLQGLVKDLKSRTVEVERLRGQVGKLGIEKNTAIAERDAARDDAKRFIRERDAAIAGRDIARDDVGELIRERDTAIAERDIARDDVGELVAQRDTAIAERDAANDGAGRLRVRVNDLETEKSDLNLAVSDAATKFRVLGLIDEENGLIRNFVVDNGAIVLVGDDDQPLPGATNGQIPVAPAPAPEADPAASEA